VARWVLSPPVDQFLAIEEQRPADLHRLGEALQAAHVGVHGAAFNAEQVGGFVGGRVVIDVHTQYDRLSLFTLSGTRERS
jgi:hypothetical protein